MHFPDSPNISFVYLTSKCEISERGLIEVSLKERFSMIGTAGHIALQNSRDDV
jgi:hypothetical protein